MTRSNSMRETDLQQPDRPVKMKIDSSLSLLSWRDGMMIDCDQRGSVRVGSRQDPEGGGEGVEGGDGKHRRGTVRPHYRRLSLGG